MCCKSDGFAVIPMSEAFSPIALKREVSAPHRLHARPSARLVRAAQVFEAEIILVYNGKRADAKSILDVIALSVGQGERLEIEVAGGDAEAALDALTQLFSGGFEE